MTTAKQNQNFPSFFAAAEGWGDARRNSFWKIRTENRGAWFVPQSGVQAVSSHHSSRVQVGFAQAHISAERNAESKEEAAPKAERAKESPRRIGRAG